jgi:hypothetical protein
VFVAPHISLKTFGDFSQQLSCSKPPKNRPYLRLRPISFFDISFFIDSLAASTLDMNIAKRTIASTSQLLKISLLVMATASVAIPGLGAAQASSLQSAAQPVAENLRKGLTDGDYVFGQSPLPQQPGAAYAVLSVKEGQVVGAFYAPNSSFDCFSGEVQANHLALNVVESYTQTAYPYNVALTASEALTAGEAAGSPTLEGFQPLPALSEIDQQILGICQADFAQ